MHVSRNIVATLEATAAKAIYSVDTLQGFDVFLAPAPQLQVKTEADGRQMVGTRAATKHSVYVKSATTRDFSLPLVGPVVAAWS
eukprot:7453969-Alexandrium_andersonii.AAC.1